MVPFTCEAVGTVNAVLRALKFPPSSADVGTVVIQLVAGNLPAPFLIVEEERLLAILVVQLAQRHRTAYVKAENVIAQLSAAFGRRSCRRKVLRRARYCDQTPKPKRETAFRPTLSTMLMVPPDESPNSAL